MSNNYMDNSAMGRMSEVLSLLMKENRGMSVPEILGRVDISKTTLYRLLSSMESYGFLVYDQIKKTYFLGERFFSAFLLLNDEFKKLGDIAYPFIVHLSNVVQESAKISVLAGDYTHTIVSSTGNRSIHVSTNNGASFPLHASSTGKIFLLNYSEEQLDKYFAKHNEKYTEKTKCTKEELYPDFEFIKKNGYIVGKGEYDAAIMSLSVPLQYSDVYKAAICVNFPTVHQNIINIKEMANNVKKTAQMIIEAMRKEKIEAPLTQIIDMNI